MAKLKANWILAIVCIIFVLAAFILLVQNGTLKAKANELQADINNLSTAQSELNRQLKRANATIQDLNNDKEALLGEIAVLERQVDVPPEIEIPAAE